MQPTLRYPLDDDLSTHSYMYYTKLDTTAVTVYTTTRSLVDEIGVYVGTTALVG